MENKNIESKENVRITTLKRKKSNASAPKKAKEVKKPDLSKFKFDYQNLIRTYTNLLTKYSDYFTKMIEDEAIIKGKLIDEMTNSEIEELTNLVISREVSSDYTITDIDDINIDYKKNINTASYLCKVDKSDLMVREITVNYGDELVNLICVMNHKAPKRTVKDRWVLGRGLNIITSIGYVIAYLYMLHITQTKLLFKFEEYNTSTLLGDYCISDYCKDNVSYLFEWRENCRYFLCPAYKRGINVVMEAFSLIAEEEYNARLDEEYSKKMKSSYATSYIQKKNIPDKVLVKMNNSVFLQDFSILELDQETDLSKFAFIEEEYSILKSKIDLGKLFSIRTKPELRFRKLGKHKALGLYFPAVNCVCVDLSAPTSFFHEIGHCIDYTFSKTGMLSRKSSFRHIVLNYRRLFEQQLNSLSDDSPYKEYLKHKKSYYFATTEIFARTWEMYLINVKNIESSFLKPTLSLEKGYPEANDTFYEDIKDFFDSLLEEMDLTLEKNISTLINPTDMLITPLLKLEKSTPISNQENTKKTDIEIAADITATTSKLKNNSNESNDSELPLKMKKNKGMMQYSFF